LRKRIIVRDTVYDAFMFSLLADDVREKPNLDIEAMQGKFYE